MTEVISNIKHLVLFDGACGLCNKSVKFVLKKEKNSHLFFCSLNSIPGKKTLEHYHLNNNESIVYIKNFKAYNKSGAALRLCLELKGLWPLLIVLLIVPHFIRDAIYDHIAKNRIKWFGNADDCDLTTPELSERFLV